MRRELNLTAEIKTQLPPELVSVMEQAGRLAADSRQHIYLVGGVVRDLILHRPNLDLDLVVEGDAIPLAGRLAALRKAKIVVHPAFRTAKISGDKWNVDLASARAETYRKPGALPTVVTGTLMSDMYRRDFTINAMAVDLDPKRYGKLIDYLGGAADVLRKEIRVIHDESFVDDATRIWRAIRYEQRLEFHIEPATRRLLKRNLAMLETISGDRIRHEIEAVFREERPERVLLRAAHLGVLQKIHPALQADRWLGTRFRQVRKHLGLQPPAELLFAILAYRLRMGEAEELVRYLKPGRTVIKAIEETINLKNRLESLGEGNLPPSRIHAFLAEYSETAITANQLGTDEAVIRQRLGLCLKKYRMVKTSLGGSDLKKMGVPQGPTMKVMLRDLLSARLDGKAKSKEDEINLAKAWLEKKSG